MNSEIPPKIRKVEIVIPVHNRRDTTLQALRSLRRINCENLSIHIIIVDDGSTDGTSEAVRRDFPEVQIVAGDGTLYYTAGTNRGISAALENDPDYIAAMNDDSVFHEDFLQRLIKTADANPRSIVGALLLLWDNPHKVFQVDYEWKTLTGGWVQPDKTAFDFPRIPFEVKGLAGNCLLYPAAAIRECGLMDEKKFPHSWGDFQYTVRMKNMGWRLLIEPKALVWCEPNTDPKPLHQLSLPEILRILFVNRRHPLNLQRQFISRWESAPSKFKAVAGYSVYLFNLSAKTSKLLIKKSSADIDSLADYN